MTSITEAGDVVGADLEAMLARDEQLWNGLRGSRVLVTGGTGFMGKWLLESFAHVNARLALGARAVVLSRDPARFASEHPRLHGARGIEWARGEIRDFTPPPGDYTHAIHAATDVVAGIDPLETFAVIRGGTERMLAICTERRVASLLLVSSGAVYGAQPPEVERVEESHSGAPATTDLQSAYGQGKRAAEWLAVAHAARSQYGVRIARCFAFVGPYLPLDRHFAIGNFLADRLAGRPIRVLGDGTAVRSYLYAADLARWLWTLLLRGESGTAYNVGSDEPVSIGELARHIATVDNGAVPVHVAARPVPGRPPHRYVPDTAKARALGLEPTVSLNEAIIRTLAWARARH